MMVPEVLVPGGAELGEGPVWDHRAARLVWVDIVGRCVCVTDPQSGLTESIDTPSDVGAVGLRREGGYVAAFQDGFWASGPQGWSLIAAVEDDQPELRFNDGKVDPQGSFWAGSMAYDLRKGAGSLYRLDPSGGVTRALAGVTISNGLAWDSDATTMFYIDSPTQRIDRFRYDPLSHQIAERSMEIEIPPREGAPDGLTIDEEGGLWVALWGGGRVIRYVDGKVATTISLPISQPTSCTFGGPRLDTLFITSAWQGLSAGDRETQPLAGAVFRLEPGIRGRRSPEF